jgi:hypothetical protein
MAMKTKPRLAHIPQKWSPVLRKGHAISKELRVALGALMLGAPLIGALPARADNIRNPIGVFAGLDKITGRIIAFEVAIDETVQFGDLQVTPRTCLTRPQTETPLTEGFVEVDEIDSGKTTKRIFSGWMFAASPGLHGVEHPVYDVWLTDCKGGVEATAAPANAPGAASAPPANAVAAPANSAPAKKPRRTIEPQNPVEPTLPESAPVDINPPLPDSAPAAQPSLDPGHAAPVGPAQVQGDGSGLGTPIEVGPPPGAAKKPKPKPKPKPAAKPAASPQNNPFQDSPSNESDPVPPGFIPGAGNN